MKEKPLKVIPKALLSIIVVLIFCPVFLSGCNLEEPTGDSEGWLYASIRVFVYTVVLGWGQVPLDDAEVTLEYYSDEYASWELADMKKTNYLGEALFTFPNVFKVYESGTNDWLYRIKVKKTNYQDGETAGLQPTFAEPELYVAIELLE